jgi:hypothetical protein
MKQSCTGIVQENVEYLTVRAWGLLVHYTDLVDLYLLEYMVEALRPLPRYNRDISKIS